MTHLAHVAEKAKELLHSGLELLCVTGDGLGSEGDSSGTPLSGARWREYAIEEILSSDAFVRDPDLVWTYHEELRAKAGHSKPGRAHRAFASLQEKRRPFPILTLAVDGLHRKAGSMSAVEMLGNLQFARCTVCPSRIELCEDPAAVAVRTCSQCQGVVRPDVVWFGEPVDPEIVSQALALARRSQVLLLAGLSEPLCPALGVLLAARSAGARIIVVSRESNAFAREAHHVLLGDPGELVTALLE